MDEIRAIIRGKSRPNLFFRAKQQLNAKPSVVKMNIRSLNSNQIRPAHLLLCEEKSTYCEGRSKLTSN